VTTPEEGAAHFVPPLFLFLGGDVSNSTRISDPQATRVGNGPEKVRRAFCRSVLRLEQLHHGEIFYVALKNR